MYESLQLPGDPGSAKGSVNIGVIRGGTEANIIPGSCEVEMMFRLTGDVSVVKKLVEKWVDGRAEINVGFDHSGAVLSHDAGFRDCADVVHVGHSSARSLGYATAVRARVHSRRAHADEYIDVNELRASVDAYQRIVRSLLQ